MNNHNLTVMLIDDDEVHNFLCEETIKYFNLDIRLPAKVKLII
jgi:hypothetical protein